MEEDLRVNWGKLRSEVGPTWVPIPRLPCVSVLIPLSSFCKRGKVMSTQRGCCEDPMRECAQSGVHVFKLLAVWSTVF